MNAREDEEWVMVNGKVQRIEGPAVTGGIQEIVEVEIKEKDDTKSKTKKKLKKKLK